MCGSLPDFEISHFRTRQIPDKSQTNPRQIPYRKWKDKDEVLDEAHPTIAITISPMMGVPNFLK